MTTAFDEIIQMDFTAGELVEIGRAFTLTMKNLNNAMAAYTDTITPEEAEALKKSIERMSSIMNKIGVALEANTRRP